MNDPSRTESAGRGAVKSYYPEVRLRGAPLEGSWGRIRNPWPMTQAEGWTWFLGFVVAFFAGSAIAVWLGYHLFEPSLWRVLPLVLWFGFLVFLGPKVLQRLRPVNIEHRRAHQVREH